MRLIMLIATYKTWNPFLWLWWRILWLWHKIKDREVYLSRPAVIKINDDGNLGFSDTNIIISPTPPTEFSMNDTIKIINSAKEWKSL